MVKPNAQPVKVLEGGRPGDLLEWLAADPGRAEGLAGQDPRWVARYPGFNAAVYSIDAFLPLVDFHQEEYWTPGSGPRWSWAWFVKTVYLPFHIISGWIVATLFAASFTRLARQE